LNTANSTKTNTINKKFLGELNDLIIEFIKYNIPLSHPDYENGKVYNELLLFILRIIVIIKSREDNRKETDEELTLVEYLEFIQDKKDYNLIFNFNLELFDPGEILFSSIVKELTPYIKSSEFKIEVLGLLFEELSHKSVKVVDENVELFDTTDRKDNGVFYTDLNMVKFTVSKTIEQYNGYTFEMLLKLNFLDPAMGSGFFLIELIRQLAKKYTGLYDPSKTKYLIAKNVVCGVDKNILAVELAKLSIWLEINDSKLPLNFLDNNFKNGDSLLFYESELLSDNNFSFFNWYEEFPAVFLNDNNGFDAIIGNPPWGKVKPNMKDYFSYNTDNLLHSFQGESLKSYVRKSEEQISWNRYEGHIKRYVKLLKNNNFFSAQKHNVNGKTTGGDFDLYRFFLELSYKLLNDKGVLGFLIPSSFYLSESATGLRYLFFNNGSIKYLVNYENKKKLFPIHPSFKFSILIYHKGINKGNIEKVYFNLVDTLSLEENNFTKLNFAKFRVNDLNLLSYNLLTIPEIHSNLELELTRRLYSSFPPLGKYLDDDWNISFKRELDMTNDSKSFLTKKEIDLNSNNYVPLYEGRMVHQYDYSYKEYISGHNRSAKWTIQPYDNKKIVPHYYVSKKYLEDKSLQSVSARPRAGFCDVTGQKNERTVLATLIPPNTICGNKVPTVDFGEQNELRLHLLWIGISNSFVIDWLIRQKMTTTLNFFHWEQIPFPRLGINTPIAKELILRVAQLVYISDDSKEIFNELLLHYPKKEVEKFNIKPSLKERANLRAEIEILVANLFNINLRELALILYAFPSLDRQQPSIHKDKNIYSNKTLSASYVTRDYVLNKYIQMNELVEKDIVQLYSEIGINIDEKIGSKRFISDRVKEYEKLGAIAFKYC
jgi:Alw26I/Eco31I/Esp3I family type II restriction m6 adenine DNA methyltransferase